MRELIQVSKWLALPTRGSVLQKPFILLAIGSSYQFVYHLLWLCVSCNEARGIIAYECPPPSKVVTWPNFKMIRTQAFRGLSFCVGWMRGTLVCKKSLSTKNSHQFPAILNVNSSNQPVPLHYELLIMWTFNWCAFHWCCVCILSLNPNTKSTDQILLVCVWTTWYRR